MNIKKLLALLFLCALIIIPQTGCNREEPVAKSGFYLDTVCTITVYNMREKKAEKAIEHAFACCDKYEKLLSKTVRDSDVDKINLAGGKPVTVSPETAKVIKRGIGYGKLSGGRFDITIGAVSALWNFTGENPKVPKKPDIEKALKTVDYRKVTVKGQEVTLENPRAQLDLGGIAKGFVADQVTQVMEADGVEQAIINLGGNIVAIGEKAEAAPWSIGIERPYSDRTAIIGSVEVADETITTSGIYERKFEEKGKLYHHVLDPKTGYPIETDLEAVTVKMEKGRSMDCDAFGTMCLMLGEKESTALIKKTGDVQAAFLDHQDQIKTVGGMDIKPAE